LLAGAASDETKEDATEAKKETTTTNEGGSIPEGVEVIKMPRLSDTMEEGTVAAWLKKVGDTVEEGDILAEIETDKATMEFESFYSGVLLHIGIQEGESSLVDTILAVIGPEGTDVQAVLSASAGHETDAPKSAETPKPADESKPAVAATKSTVSNDGRRIFASPLAKKIAADKGIDLATISGSGDNGRVIKKDVENYQPSQTTAAPGAGQKVEAATALAAAPINLPVGEEGSELK